MLLLPHYSSSFSCRWSTWKSSRCDNRVCIFQLSLACCYQNNTFVSGLRRPEKHLSHLLIKWYLLDLQLLARWCSLHTFFFILIHLLWAVIIQYVADNEKCGWDIDTRHSWAWWKRCIYHMWRCRCLPCNSSFCIIMLSSESLLFILGKGGLSFDKTYHFHCTM